jgi:hypothetical protein
MKKWLSEKLHLLLEVTDPLAVAIVFDMNDAASFFVGNIGDEIGDKRVEILLIGRVRLRSPGTFILGGYQTR